MGDLTHLSLFSGIGGLAESTVVSNYAHGRGGEREMTTQEAIETIEITLGEVEWEYPMNYAVAFEMAIEALKKEEGT
jgi:hypothetical protein